MTFIKIAYFIFKGLTVLHYRNKNRSLVGIDTESHNGAVCINQGFFFKFPMALLFFSNFLVSYPFLSDSENFRHSLRSKTATPYVDIVSALL